MMKLEAKIVTTMDEFQACVAIRGAAFLARGEPYSDEFDGNDLVSATHVLVRQDNQPVGAMRIRIVTAGTAVWERFAILPVAGRSIRILNLLADYAREYTMFKGCHTVLGGVSDPRLMRFWKKRGFVETGRPPVSYNGTDYLQVRLRLSPVSRIPDLHDASLAEAAAFQEIHSEGERQLPTQITSYA